MTKQTNLFHQELDKFKFNSFTIPNYMRESIRLYIEDGIHPGSFLKGIITNDLFGAVGQADKDNIREIPAFVNYFYNYAPLSCWGSIKAMNNWIKQKKKNERKRDG